MPKHVTENAYRKFRYQTIVHETERQRRLLGQGQKTAPAPLSKEEFRHLLLKEMARVN